MIAYIRRQLRIRYLRKQINWYIQRQVDNAAIHARCVERFNYHHSTSNVKSADRWYRDLVSVRNSRNYITTRLRELQHELDSLTTP